MPRHPLPQRLKPANLDQGGWIPRSTHHNLSVKNFQKRPLAARIEIMKTFAIALALLSALRVTLPAAPVPAVNWDGAQAIFFSDNDGPFTTGFRFRADSDLKVSALGAFDYQGDGLVAAHGVGIWSPSGGAPLASATVPLGTAAPLLGAFRYATIPDLILSANTEYIIGASDYYGQDTTIHDIYPWSAQGYSFAAGVTFLAAPETDNESFGLVFPDMEENPGSPLTANFQFVAIPEPSGSLIACTFLGMVLLLKTRRKAHQI
jgi:hypothetical protein